MGVTGVRFRAGLSTGDMEEAYVKRALSAQAAETVVLASAEKLNAASAFKICEVGQATTLIVQTDTAPGLVAQVQQLGVTVVLAPPT